jgi:hypothetical protein
MTPTQHHIRETTNLAVKIAGSRQKLSQITGISAPQLRFWQTQTKVLNRRGLKQFERLESYLQRQESVPGSGDYPRVDDCEQPKHEWLKGYIVGCVISTVLTTVVCIFLGWWAK